MSEVLTWYVPKENLPQGAEPLDVSEILKTDEVDLKARSERRKGVFLSSQIVGKNTLLVVKCTDSRVYTINQDQVRA